MISACKTKQRKQIEETSVVRVLLLNMDLACDATVSKNTVGRCRNWAKIFNFVKMMSVD